MIVTRSRLLFWVSVIILPFALLCAVVPGAVAVSLVLIFGFFVMAIVDAFGARKNLAGIDVELPAVVRMSKDRETKFEIRIRNLRQLQRQLRLGIALPREIK